MLSIILLSGWIVLDQPATPGTSLTGSWKLIGTLPANPVGQDSTLLLIEASGTKGTWKVLDHGISAFNGSKVQATAVSADNITLSIKGPVSIEVFLKRKVTSPNRWLGTFDLRGNWFPCAFEKYQGKTLSEDKKESPTPGSDLFKTLEKAEGLEDKAKVVIEILAQHSACPAAIKASQHLLDQLSSKTDIKTIEKCLNILDQSIGDYPFQLSNPILASQASSMVRNKIDPAQAFKLLELIKSREVSPVSPESQRRVLKLEAAIYPLIGKKSEGITSFEKLEVIEKSLDDEFNQKAIPFPTKPTSLKTATGLRPRVLELFTGAQCPPCVAADIAFDALDKSFISGDLILLQYHLHIPGPDALTNAHSEMRARYYGINSTPSVYINGTSGPAVGGLKPNAQAAFSKLVSALNEKPASDSSIPNLNIKVKKSENNYVFEVNHEKVEKPQQLLLRLVLVEKAIRYAGRNGQRIHHQVVRSFVGDPKGLALENSTGSQEIKVNIDTVKSDLEAYLDASNKRRPFPDDERPLNLTELSVIGLLQNIETKEIIQATKVPLK